MSKPELLVMAAGLGSRYGGLKQIDPVSDKGEIILDFSLYDAMMAGFEDVCFVIKKDREQDFRDLLDGRAGKYLNITYAYQDIADLPEGYPVPEGRTKPWGTAHAVWSARNRVKGPFAVINADDYYGSSAFQLIYDYLEKDKGEESSGYHYAMVAYELAKTMTENGSVARGICRVSEQHKLISVTERTKIFWHKGVPVYTEDDGTSYISLSPDQPVSMNFWGFTGAMMEELDKLIPVYLDRVMAEDPLKGECFLPDAVTDQLKEGCADVKVLQTRDTWHGVTYREDKEDVIASLQSMKDKGFYPDKLWK